MSETEVQKHVREISELHGQLKDAEEKYQKLDDAFKDMESHYIWMAQIIQKLVNCMSNTAKDVSQILDDIDAKNIEIRAKHPDVEDIKIPD